MKIYSLTIIYLSSILACFASEHMSSGIARLNRDTCSILQLSPTLTIGTKEFNDLLQKRLDRYRTPASFVAWLIDRADATNTTIRVTYGTGSLIILFIIHQDELFISKLNIDISQDRTLALCYTNAFNLPFQIPLDQIESVPEEEAIKLQRSSIIDIPKN